MCPFMLHKNDLKKWITWILNRSLLHWVEVVWDSLRCSSLRLEQLQNIQEDQHIHHSQTRREAEFMQKKVLHNLTLVQTIWMQKILNSFWQVMRRVFNKVWWCGQHFPPQVLWLPSIFKTMHFRGRPGFMAKISMIANVGEIKRSVI